MSFSEDTARWSGKIMAVWVPKVQLESTKVCIKSSEQSGKSGVRLPRGVILGLFRCKNG